MKPPFVVVLRRVASWVLMLLSPSLSAQVARPEPPTIEWTLSQGHRQFPVAPQGSGSAGFTLLSSDATGLAFTNVLGEAAVAKNRVSENGSGVALGDVDGDGWCDIYLCGLEGPNALYRNLGGMRFEDITASAGVACESQLSTGALLADVDGDADLDLLVNSLGGGTRLFINDGRGRFTERMDTRLTRRFAATSMAMADIDRDGDLDLYVANYRTINFRDEFPPVRVEARMVDGQVSLLPAGRFIPMLARQGQVEIFELGERDFLYINQGGSFAPVSWTTGSFVDASGMQLKSPPQDWGLAVAFRDLNQDGWPDLYVCNDFFFSPDRIWINRGGAGFREATAREFSQIPMSSMAVDFADINRDGFDDIFVAEMLGRDHPSRQRRRDNVKKTALARELGAKVQRWESPRNMLYLNRGDSTYAEVAQYAGLDATEWSWGAIFCDVDLDGYEDLIIPTGNNHDVQDADALRQISRARGPDSLEHRMANLALMPTWRTPILGYRNKGDMTFEDRGVDWGFTVQRVVHGAAMADLDNDGDLDLVANSLNSPVLCFRNNSTAPRIAVRLKGRPPNTKGIGAVVSVAGGGLTQRQEMMAGGRYLSSDDSIRVFAALGEREDRRVEVVWPDGHVTAINAPSANTVYELDQRADSADGAGSSKSSGARRPAGGTQFFPATFPSLPAAVGGYEDLEIQPTLSHSVAPRGTRVAVVDLDSDGEDDLVLSARAGATMICLLGDGQGGWTQTSPGWAAIPAPSDQTAILPVRLAPQRHGLAIAYSPTTPGGNSMVAIVDLAKGVVAARIETGPGPIGSLHAADIDGDGDLDLFCAATSMPGAWPLAASSHVLLNHQGVLSVDKRQKALVGLGIVTGARLLDLNEDNLPELVVALDCGPIRILKNSQGVFEVANGNFGLNSGVGRWTALEVGDFNSDGRPDFVAGNLGRNSRHQSASPFPYAIQFADVEGDRVVEVIETLRSKGSAEVLPWLDYETLSKRFPWIETTFPTHREFGVAPARAVWAGEWGKVQMVEIMTHDSILFLSADGGYQARPLPFEAQISPARSFLVADFNQDGRDDLLVGQNLLGTRPDISPYDAGHGLLLLTGEGGEFRAVSKGESGLDLQGEQISMALLAGRAHGAAALVVAQNFGPTVAMGIRVGSGPTIRFEDGPGNPEAVGLRWRATNAGGSARWEFSGGTTHLGRWRILPGETEVHCLWADGTAQKVRIPASGRHLVSRTRGVVSSD